MLLALLLLAIFVALVAFFANKILNIVKENSKRTSYTHVPDELKNIVDNSPESIFLMHINALRKYLG